MEQFPHSFSGLPVDDELSERRQSAGSMIISRPIHKFIKFVCFWSADWAQQWRLGAERAKEKRVETIGSRRHNF